VSTFPHVVIILGSNDLPTSLDPALSSSTGLAQAFDPDYTGKQTSQGSPCFEASGISSQPSVGGSGKFETARLPLRDQDIHLAHQKYAGDSFDIGSLLAQDVNYLAPQSRNIPPPRSTLGSDPLPQCIPSATPQTPESAFADDLFHSEWPCTHPY